MKEQLNFKTELHLLFYATTQEMKTTQQILYKYPCIPTKQEMAVAPEFEEIIKDNISVDFLIESKEADKIVYEAYHTYCPENDESFKLLYKFFQNRDIELQMLSEKSISRQLAIQNMPLYAFKHWLEDKENEDFYDNNIYMFMEQALESNQNLQFEIEKYAEINVEPVEKLEEMIKFLLYMEYISVHSSNPLDFNNKFHFNITFDDIYEHLPF